MEIDESDSSDNDVFISSSNLGNDSLLLRNVGRKNKPFDAFMCADSVPKQNRTVDEVSKYNMAPPDSVARTRKEFLADESCVVKCWYAQRMKFPNLFALAVRVFATPVSSCTSERVFSTLKIFVDEKRSHLSTSLVDDMIVIHSLHT